VSTCKIDSQIFVDIGLILLLTSFDSVVIAVFIAVLAVVVAVVTCCVYMGYSWVLGSSSEVFQIAVGSLLVVTDL